MGKNTIDEIGYWSEVKLDLVRKYAKAYSAIMSQQPEIRGHLYIDGFAGAGIHVSKTSNQFIPGSPLNALNVTPPFDEFHFIDLDGGKTEHLRSLTKGRTDVYVYEGDCNQVLLRTVFPRARWKDYRRALCLLDPYGLDLTWEVIYAAGESRSIEIFLNFPIMDMNRNVLWHDPGRVDDSQLQRMDAYWGGRERWQDVAYAKTQGLFEEMEKKVTNPALAEAFRRQLREVAGFAYVPEPLPMRNSKGATVYYLFFASPNKTGGKIVREIFEKYQKRGM